MKGTHWDTYLRDNRFLSMITVDLRVSLTLVIFYVPYFVAYIIAILSGYRCMVTSIEPYELCTLSFFTGLGLLDPLLPFDPFVLLTGLTKSLGRIKCGFFF